MPEDQTTEIVDQKYRRLIQEMQAKLRHAADQLEVAANRARVGPSDVTDLRRLGREIFAFVNEAPEPVPEGTDTKLLDRSVAAFGFSVRIRKTARRLGFSTVGELLTFTAAQLLDVKNFGQVSLAEIREKLARYGLYLRGDKPQDQGWRK